MLVKEQSGNNRDSGKVPPSQTCPVAEGDQQQNGCHMTQPRDVEGCGNSKTGWDRMQSVRAIELRILTGIDEIETCCPEKNCQAQPAREPVQGAAYRDPCAGR